MDQGIVLQGFVPLRREPSETSEMISQVLFGESFEIIESNREWSFIELFFDGYRGWLNTSAVEKIEEHNGSSEDYRIVTSQATIVTRRKTGQQVILPAGSVANKIVEGLFNINGELFLTTSEKNFTPPGKTNDIEVVAKQLVSIPYLWGGRCGFGFDCSGLVQLLCRIKGIDLPRDSTQQSEQGKNINFIHEMQAGDLAFFDNTEGEITHVGMVLDGGRIIHSSGFVKIDRLDQQGIFNIEKGKYTHRLRVIKRI